MRRVSEVGTNNKKVQSLATTSNTILNITWSQNDRIWNIICSLISPGLSPPPSPLLPLRSRLSLLLQQVNSLRQLLVPKDKIQAAYSSLFYSILGNDNDGHVTNCSVDQLLFQQDQISNICHLVNSSTWRAQLPFPLLLFLRMFLFDWSESLLVLNNVKTTDHLILKTLTSLLFFKKTFLEHRRLGS